MAHAAVVDRGELIERMLVEDIARVPWRPLIDLSEPNTPTPQRQAYESQADVLFYGGAAGGGKSDLLIGLALTAHRRSIIFRREAKQLVAIEERVSEILRTRNGYNSQKQIWRLPGQEDRILEFGHCQHLGDEQAYQGRPHDLKGFDEITHFLESQFRFLCGWMRSVVSGQRQRIVATGNPPTTSDGDWVIKYWAPWLDDQHRNPALFGELRWFAVIDGADREVEGPAPFDYKGERIKPKSRTFIPSKVEDNPYLIRTGYRATLQALPEPLRSQMLKGDFMAGREDDPWQVIPTAWVEAAFERWRIRGKPKDAKLSQVGADVARGGIAETVIAKRYEDWVDELVVHPGHTTPDGPSVAALIVAELRPGAFAAVDVIGVGSSVYDHLKGNGVAVAALNGSEQSMARDRSGTLKFANKRAEWWWRMREKLDPSSDEDVALPPDPALKADLCAPRWTLQSRGIQVERKEELIKRIGRSPDRGDAVVNAFADDAQVMNFRRPGLPLKHRRVPAYRASWVA